CVPVEMLSSEVVHCLGTTSEGTASEEVAGDDSIGAAVESEAEVSVTISVTVSETVGEVESELPQALSTKSPPTLPIAKACRKSV
ncbi:MAG TPA: hypothetical protein K8W18_03400, partial [Corynebacterium glutamicum]|nr:hypothetical protein [Corynebacterium glutamicum]